MPGLTLHLGDRLAAEATLYLPFGSRPADGVPRSFYGIQPFTAFVQPTVFD